MSSTIFAFDFDGVLCDSANETGITGWKTLVRLGRAASTAEPPGVVLRDFPSVRPCLNLGWESILLAHLLLTEHSVHAINDQYASSLKRMHKNNR